MTVDTNVARGTNAADDTGRLETRAKFSWVDQRPKGIRADIIARKSPDGWSMGEKILGEDIRWYPVGQEHYQRLCDYAEDMFRRGALALG